jgi:hypothetical protein
MPPKRTFFSLNLESETEHLYRRVTDHNDNEKDKVTVWESTAPSVGSTKVEFWTRPLEHVVDRTTVEGATEKKIVSREGEVNYQQRSSEGPGHGQHADRKTTTTTTTVGKKTKQSGKEKDRDPSVDETYDTSDL